MLVLMHISFREYNIPYIVAENPIDIGYGWQFLGEFHSSRNRGVEEWQIYIPRGSRKMESIPRGPWGISRNELSKKSLKILISTQKIQINFEKNWKKIQHWFYISKLGNNTKNWSWNTEFFLTNFWKLSEIFIFKGNSVFSSPRQIWARIRRANEW